VLTRLKPISSSESLDDAEEGPESVCGADDDESWDLSEGTAPCVPSLSLLLEGLQHRTLWKAGGKGVKDALWCGQKRRRKGLGWVAVASYRPSMCQPV
jgi:hypothetical protein